MKTTALGTSGGQGGYPFAEYVIPDGARIAAIRVLSGWYVDSIQVIYADATGNETPLEQIGGAGLHFAEHENRFVLDADEYLVGISGASGQYVDNIRFHTNKRLSDVYGGHGGENAFSYMADAGSQVVGFWGRADWYLDAVGVLVAERPTAEAPKKAAAKKAAPKQEAVAAAPVAEAPKKATKKAAAKKDVVVEAPAVEAPKKATKKATTKKDAVIAAPAVEETPKAPKKAAAKKDAVAALDAEAPKKAARKPAAKKETAAEPVTMVEETRAAAVVEAIAVTPDDLTVIEGIGPKIAELLTTNGIATFTALAATPAERLKEILLSGGRRFAIADPTTWPQQGGLAASGDTAGLAALQESLKGGRKAN